MIEIYIKVLKYLNLNKGIFSYKEIRIFLFTVIFQLCWKIKIDIQTVFLSLIYFPLKCINASILI